MGCCSSYSSSQSQKDDRNIIAITNQSSGDAWLEAVLPQFDAYARDAFNRSGVPGAAVAIVYKDKVVYLKCFGVKKAGSPEVIDADTLFPLGSNSKSISTVALASLVDDGLIGWDDKVIDHYPDFRLYDPYVTDHMTIRDCLCHRSGLPEYIGDNLVADFGYNKSEVLYRLRFQKPITEFRAAFAYENVFYTVAAEAASRAAGVRWEDLVADRIFKPLGMNSTIIGGAAYGKAEDKVQVHADAEFNGTMKASEFSNYDVYNPAGGVCSSIADMTNYVRMQLSSGQFEGRRIISSEALNETHKPQMLIGIYNDSIYAYAMGWSVTSSIGHMILTHSGDFAEGASCLVTLYPSEQMGIVVLTNAFPEGNCLNYALTGTLEDFYFKGKSEADLLDMKREEEKKRINGSILDPYEHLPPSPSIAKSNASLDSYTGVYSNDFYGTIKLAQKDSKLQLYLGHASVPLNLIPWSGDIFREERTNTAAIFTMGANGKAYQVLLKRFDFNGRNGLFSRMKES